MDLILKLLASAVTAATITFGGNQFVDIDAKKRAATDRDDVALLRTELVLERTAREKERSEARLRRQAERLEMERRLTLIESDMEHYHGKRRR